MICTRCKKESSQTQYTIMFVERTISIAMCGNCWRIWAELLLAIIARGTYNTQQIVVSELEKFARSSDDC